MSSGQIANAPPFVVGLGALSLPLKKAGFRHLQKKLKSKSKRDSILDLLSVQIGLMNQPVGLNLMASKSVGSSASGLSQQYFRTRRSVFFLHPLMM